MTDLIIKTMKMPDDIVIIGLSGVLDSNTETNLIESIRKIQDEGISNFVFDLSNMNAITSSGIGAFIKIANSCRDNYGNIAIVQPQPAVKEALDLFGLFNFIKAADDVNNAVKLLLD
jgi:anti-anti-sigma factor